MLHRVKSELHARWQSNQDLVSSIQERLAQHSSQLMDLRDALNEAVNKTRQTEDLNSLNRNNLEESQVGRCSPWPSVMWGAVPALLVPNSGSLCPAKESGTPKAARAGAGDPADGQGRPCPGL